MTTSPLEVPKMRHLAIENFISRVADRPLQLLGHDARHGGAEGRAQGVEHGIGPVALARVGIRVKAGYFAVVKTQHPSRRRETFAGECLGVDAPGETLHFFGRETR